MRRIVIFLMAFMMVQVAVSGQNSSTIQASSPEFAKIIVEEQGILLDVRTKREFQNGHIENAGNLNFYAFDFRKRLLLLAKDKPIYLYCNTGYRSDRAADFLIRNGYERVYNLRHGIMEWDLYELTICFLKLIPE
ncbi:MAG: rhodanese-like domain-containing protein [Bacteroidales bacterium]